METEQKLNGANHSPAVVNEKRIITCYKKRGRTPTLKRYGLTDSRLYGLLNRAGVSLTTSRGGSRAAPGRRISRTVRPGKGLSARPGRGTKTPPGGAYRGLYKARRGARQVPAIDALLYLEKARSRLLRGLGEGLDPGPSLPVLGLIGLAIDSLRGESE